MVPAGPPTKETISSLADLLFPGDVVIDGGNSNFLDLIALALEKDPQLSDIKAWVEDSGEGRWTVIDAIDHSVPAPVIALSLFLRFSSRQEDSYAEKLLAAMRNEFGGHTVKHEQ